METINTSELTLKTATSQRNSESPNGRVRAALIALKPGEALYMQDLAKDMCSQFTLSTDDLKKRRMRAYIRVGMVYKRLEKKEHLSKFVDAAGFTLIGRSAEK